MLTEPIVNSIFIRKNFHQCSSLSRQILISFQCFGVASISTLRSFDKYEFKDFSTYLFFTYPGFFVKSMSPS